MLFPSFDESMNLQKAKGEYRTNNKFLSYGCIEAKSHRNRQAENGEVKNDICDSVPAEEIGFIDTPPALVFVPKVRDRMASGHSNSRAGDEKANEESGNEIEDATKPQIDTKYSIVKKKKRGFRGDDVDKI